MQKDDDILLVCGCFKTRSYAKRWFRKDAVRRVILLTYYKKASFKSTLVVNEIVFTLSDRPSDRTCVRNILFP